MQTVIVGTAALGMTLIMIAGGIDLSVGSTVALVTVCIAVLVQEADPILPEAVRDWQLVLPAGDRLAGWRWGGFAARSTAP